MRFDLGPTAAEKRKMAAAALPDPAYLADLRRYGDRPSPEIIAEGWQRFERDWQTSKAGRPYLELAGLRVLVFDNRTRRPDVRDPATGRMVASYSNPDLGAPFTVGFGHDDGKGLRYLIGGADAEAEAIQLGCAVVLAFIQAGHAPEPWLKPEKSPKQLAWLELGDAFAERLRKDWAYADRLEEETAAWLARQWAQKAARRVWEQERTAIERRYKS